MGAGLIANNVPDDANLGGPIYKGKAWFFASWRLNNQFKYITGLPGVLAQSKLPNITIKGTYQVSRGNQFVVYWNKRTKLQPLRDLSTVVPISAAYYQASENYPYKGEWTSVINNRMFLDVIVGNWRNDFPLRPTAEGGTYSGTMGPGRIDLNSGQYLDGGANSFYQKQRRYKPQYTVALHYSKQGWLGDHDFKNGSTSRWEKRLFSATSLRKRLLSDRGRRSARLTSTTPRRRQPQTVLFYAGHGRSSRGSP